MIKNVKIGNELEFKQNFPEHAIKYINENIEEEKRTNIPEQKFAFYNNYYL